MKRIWLGMMLLWAAATLLPAQQPHGSRYVSPWKTPWDYSGPRGAEHWSELDPAYRTCNSGREQSPIDIRNARKAQLPPLQFDYSSEPLRHVINNAHTIRVDYHDRPGRGSYLVVGEERYQLTQFHFHRPSEEYVHGKPYDMVLHLMHRAADGKIVGVAVLLTAGRANSTIEKVWQHMPRTEGQLAVTGVTLNPAGMLPRDTRYYRYEGSQTAPPCTEGVTWLVLKTPVEIAPEQIRAFAALYPHDVRPIQPLNGREVLESQ
ncbi:MAG TPA: carbonic anhydrase family protein [Steroidobacteraceae bacterium]|nr:carbonic anhydrase family protein [Steroidobacteraceae bacterium]